MIAARNARDDGSNRPFSAFVFVDKCPEIDIAAIDSDQIQPLLDLVTRFFNFAG